MTRELLAAAPVVGVGDVLALAEGPALVVTALIVLDAEDALDALCEVEALPTPSA